MAKQNKQSTTTLANALKGATREELLALLLNTLTSEQAPAKVAKATKKPTTRKQALAKWEADKGINADNKAKFKALYAEHHAADWQAWRESAEYLALSKAKRHAANVRKEAELTAKYALMAGQKATKK